MANANTIRELAAGPTFDVKRDGAPAVLLAQLRERLDPEILRFLDRGQQLQWGLGLLFCNDSTIRDRSLVERRILGVRFPLRPGFEALAKQIVERARADVEVYDLSCHQPYFEKYNGAVALILEASPEKVADQIQRFARLANETYRALSRADACAWAPTQQSGSAYDVLVDAAASGESGGEIAKAGNAWLAAQRHDAASARVADGRIERWAGQFSPPFNEGSSGRVDVLERTPRRSWSTERTSQPRDEQLTSRGTGRYVDIPVGKGTRSERWQALFGPWGRDER